MSSKQLQSSPIPKSIKTVCREIPSQHVLLHWPRYPLPNQRPHKLIIHVTAIISSTKRQHGNTMKYTKTYTFRALLPVLAHRKTKVKHAQVKQTTLEVVSSKDCEINTRSIINHTPCTPLKHLCRKICTTFFRRHFPPEVHT